MGEDDGIYCEERISASGVAGDRHDDSVSSSHRRRFQALEKTLNSLEWSSFKKKEGEWTFLRNRDGSLVDTLTTETDFVNQLRKGKELVVGRYRYVVSDDKFLNRYFVEA